MRYVLATVLAASAALSPATALAREHRYQIDIRAGDLADALATLSAQTGISLATDGALPRVRSGEAIGVMNVREALERVLRPTAFRAKRVGSMTWRIVRRPRAPEIEPVVEAQPAEAEIVVTGRKQTEILQNVAGAAAVYVPAERSRSGVGADAHSVAEGIDGLVLTHLGPGRDRPFIRGVADSPFDGFSQSTVSVNVNDARVTYDAAEPGLRLVDVARVEVLKGPQGPLYGTGAIGGVYRIVTNQPVLGTLDGSAEIGFSGVARGGLGGEAEAVLNVPIVDDRMAVRAVGYTAAEPGWINDTDGRSDVNRSLTYGGRLALRVAPAAGWTVDLTAAGQVIHARDSQYVDRDAYDLTRTVPIAEPHTGSLRLAQATVSGPIGGTHLTVATGYAWQDQSDIFDASASAAALNVSAPAAYRDRRAYRVFDQEVRLASASGSSFAWVAGASYLSATTQANGDLSSNGGSWAPFFFLHRRVSEAALFADGSLPIAERVRASIGVRLFRATTDDRQQEAVRAAFKSKTLIGVTPSASISYQLAPDQLIYAHFGTAFRPGGIDQANTVTGRYEADEVRSFDLGGRMRFSRLNLSVTFDAFHSEWRDIQSDYLQADGLIATHNAGAATANGIDGSIEWRPGRHWQVLGGLTLQRPRLVRGSDGIKLPVDRRLPVVPDFAGRLQVSRDFEAGTWRVSPYLALNLMGASRLSFDDGLDREMEGYVMSRAGVSAERRAFTVRLDIDNLMDARSDTFAFGNPFSVRSVRQYTPMRPRSVNLSLSRKF